MKREEFRIGNLVNYRIIDEIDERKQWYEVSRIDEFDFMQIDDDYQPIELTEEWLLKFGFEKHDTTYTTSYKPMFYFLIEDFEYKETGFKGFIYPLTEIGYFLSCQYVHLQHVHQLQNLYFALTGLELEYED